MGEILRDPVWQFIGVVSAVMISFIVYFIQKQKKSISYEFITNARLLSVSESIKGNIKILYDDKPVNDVYLIEINIFNSGNAPIQENEYNTGINISFGSKSNVLTAGIVFADPADINPNIVINNTNIIINSILLNKGDSVVLKIIATQVSGIKVEGRIVGVKKIDQYDPKKGFLVYAIISLGLMTFILINFVKKYITTPWILLLLMLFAVGIFIYGDSRNSIRISNCKKRMKNYMEQKAA